METLSIFMALLALTTASLSAQESAPKKEGQTVTFRFVPGEDMLYIPWGGNDAELNRLSSLIDEYRTEITTGQLRSKQTISAKAFPIKMAFFLWTITLTIWVGIQPPPSELPSTLTLGTASPTPSPP